MIYDALAQLPSDLPEKGEPIPARSSERDTVTSSSKDAAKSVLDMYEKTYDMSSEATEDNYGEVLPELSERTLLDDVTNTYSEEAEDSYEETVPEATNAAYEAIPTPSEVYGAAPKPIKVYEAVPTPTEGAYEALPTPVKDTYESTPIEDSYEESKEDKEDTYDELDLSGLFRKRA
jgi:hypothetical protein